MKILSNYFFISKLLLYLQNNLYRMVILITFVSIDKRGSGCKSTTFFHAMQESPSFFYDTRLFVKVSPDLIISRSKQNSEALDDMGTKAVNTALQGHWCGRVPVTQKTVKLLIGTTKL
jgi:hypothetical protein